MMNVFSGRIFPIGVLVFIACVMTKTLGFSLGASIADGLAFLMIVFWCVANPWMLRHQMFRFLPLGLCILLTLICIAHALLALHLTPGHGEAMPLALSIAAGLIFPFTMSFDWRLIHQKVAP